MYLDTLSVHLVILFRLCPVETSVTFFANEQVWEVDLFEFKLDGLDETSSDFLCSLGTCIGQSE